ncbi:MAG: Ig-like domain-containing protein [Candidatus Sulfotelmatobacter sp.]
MFPQTTWYDRSIKTVATLVVVVFCGLAVAQAGTVDIKPGADIPSVVSDSPAGTTFVIYPGTYRLTEPIIPKDGDNFTGQTACAPPTTSCPAIISGSRIIGSLAILDGTNYKVTGQTQQGAIEIATTRCQPGYAGCIYPEDLFFDGVPYTHLYSASLPTIASGQGWFDYANNAIYFHDDPAGHVVETSVVPSAFTGWANNVTISGLTVREFAAPSPMAAVGLPGNTSMTEGLDWTIKNCELLLNHAAAVRTSGFGMQVLNNYIHNNGEIGIMGGSATNSTTRSTPDRLVISQNTISYNNYAHFLAGYGSGGIKLGATTSPVIRGNTVTHNDGAGIHFDMDVASPLVDGNTVTDNASGGGIQYEISLTSATIRNNIVLSNGVNLPTEPATSNTNTNSYNSVGVKAYCNVIEIPNAPQANGWSVEAGNRGFNVYPPYERLVSTGNYFHHNTVIWDSGATGWVGFYQADTVNEPNFFVDNTAPDFNTYHLPSASLKNFIFDNDNSGENTHLTFSQYQTHGADVHGTVDTKYDVGYPTVKIASPADGATVSNPITVTATASDASGISKVEFYVDWGLQATVTSPPYSFDWSSATTGLQTVAAMAYSNAGIRSCYAISLTKN